MSFVKVVFFFLLAAVCLGQFTEMGNFINTTVCNYNTTCINAQPDPIVGVTAAASADGNSWNFDYTDNANWFPMLCPRGSFPDADNMETFNVCSLYVNKAVTQRCRSISYYPCTIPGAIAIPACCQRT